MAIITLQSKTELNRDFILSRVEPIDIFRKYYPGEFELNKMCLSPFKKEEDPSFIIGDKYEEITFKGFNTQHRGDCFHFVMYMFSLDYNGALSKIASDFELWDKPPNGERMNELGERVKIIKKPKFFQAVPKKFDKADTEYWAKYHLTPKDLNFCDDTKCYSTKEWAIDRQRQALKHGELCFFYNLKNERGNWIKIYRPNAEKRKKWMSNIPFREMHGLSNLKGCKVGFIQKSIKDGAFTAKYLSPHVAVLAGEDISAITKENIDYINQNCEKVYVIFDNDEQGVRECTKLTTETGWGYINPPKRLLYENITDFTDWAENTDPQTVINFFKEKGIEI